MSVFSAILFAAASPLASPSDYVFAPFANVSNAAAFIKGEIMGKDADYKTIRAEDLAFLDEAFAERNFLTGGNKKTNVVLSLQMNYSPTNISMDASFVRPGSSERYYIQPEPPLREPGLYPFRGTDYVVMVPEVVETETNMTFETKWHDTTITNSHRADWPHLAKKEIVTNTTIKPIRFFDRPVTNRLSLVDFVLGGGEYHAPTNIYDGADLSLPTIPTLEQITNLYSLSARSSRMLSLAQYERSTNAPAINIYNNDHKIYVNTTGDPSHPQYNWRDASTSITNWGDGAGASSSQIWWSEDVGLSTSGGVISEGSGSDQHYELTDGGIQSSRVSYSFTRDTVFEVRYVIDFHELPNLDNCDHFPDARVFEMWEVYVSGYDDQYDDTIESFHAVTNMIASRAPDKIESTPSNVTITVVYDPRLIALGAPQSFGVFKPGELSRSGLKTPQLPSLSQEELEWMWIDGFYDPTERIITEGSVRHREVHCAKIDEIIVLTTAFRTSPP